MMQKEKIDHIHCLITFNIYSRIKNNCGKVKFQNILLHSRLGTTKLKYCSYVVFCDPLCALILLGPLYATSPFGLHL